MNAKSSLMLFALAVVCMAAVAWAADAPKPAVAPTSRSTQVVTTSQDGEQKTVTVEVGDASDIDTDALDLEDGPDGDGADGERRVIVRRFKGGDGGCGAMCGAMGGGKGGCAMGGGMGLGQRAGMGMGRGMGMGQGPGMFGHMMQALDLSDAQREKLAAIHDRQQRRDIQARADLEIARLDLRKAMGAEKPEAFAINTQIDRVARLRSDMAKAHVASLLEARALLTPEQQQQMREMRMKSPGAGMPRMIGRGPGMGPGGMGGPGMRRRGMPMHVRIERDTLIRR
jgi:Spy/CpxP family protein refolding chaperone